MKPAFEKIDKAIDYIEQHPDEWDQKYYWCETACCLAGHIGLRNGWRLSRDVDGDADVYKNGYILCVADAAELEILGENPPGDDYDKLTELFAPGNTLQDIKDKLIEWKAKYADVA